MPRIILIGSFAALLAASGTQSANALEGAHQSDWQQARVACADVGIDPASASFNQCVFDLYYSLWDEQNERDD